MMKFGWKAGPEQFPPTELTGYAIDAEKAGFDSANAEDHLKFVQQYIDLGFDHPIFHSALPKQRDFIEKFGRDVLPQLRAKAEKVVVGR
jgi:hypothetical protein